MNCLTALVVLVTCGAQADGPVLDPLKFDDRLRGIPFGADFEAFMKFAAKSTQGIFHSRIENTPERNERDKLRLLAQERVKQIRESRVVFAGQETGYNVSVIGGVRTSLG